MARAAKTARVQAMVRVGKKAHALAMAPAQRVILALEIDGDAKCSRPNAKASSFRAAW
jgi:hypothetical protein